MSRGGQEKTDGPWTRKNGRTVSSANSVHPFGLYFVLSEIKMHLSDSHSFDCIERGGDDISSVCTKVVMIVNFQ